MVQSKLTLLAKKALSFELSFFKAINKELSLSLTKQSQTYLDKRDETNNEQKRIVGSRIKRQRQFKKI